MNRSAAEQLSKSGVAVYPNPNNGQFQVVTSETFGTGCTDYDDGYERSRSENSEPRFGERERIVSRYVLSTRKQRYRVCDN